MIEEGTVLAAPGLPVLSQGILRAAVEEAHRQHNIAIAHVLTAESSRLAIEVGVEGLAHLFIDRPATTPDLGMIAEAGAFVTPVVSAFFIIRYSELE